MTLPVQGRREGTSSVVFEVQIMNCEIDFINLFIFNHLNLNVNLFIFSCLTSNFCFSKNKFRKQKRTAVYERATVVSDFNLTRENDNLLPYSVHEYIEMRIPSTARTFLSIIIIIYLLSVCLFSDK